MWNTGGTEGTITGAEGGQQVQHTNGGRSGGGSSGTERSQNGVPIGNMSRRPEMMAEEGNKHKGSGTENVGTLGEVGT